MLIFVILNQIEVDIFWLVLKTQILFRLFKQVLSGLLYYSRAFDCLGKLALSLVHQLRTQSLPIIVSLINREAAAEPRQIEVRLLVVTQLVVTVRWLLNELVARVLSKVGLFCSAQLPVGHDKMGVSLIGWRVRKSGRSGSFGIAGIAKSITCGERLPIVI